MILASLAMYNVINIMYREKNNKMFISYRLKQTYHFFYWICKLLQYYKQVPDLLLFFLQADGDEILALYAAHRPSQLPNVIINSNLNNFTNGKSVMTLTLEMSF